MAATRVIYVCETCLTVWETPCRCCEGELLRIDAGEPGSRRSKPIMTEDGELRSRAPRWWVERHGPLGGVASE